VGKNGIASPVPSGTSKQEKDSALQDELFQQFQQSYTCTQVVSGSEVGDGDLSARLGYKAVAPGKLYFEMCMAWHASEPPWFKYKYVCKA
jgi:hypothetical protein